MSDMVSWISDNDLVIGLIVPMLRVWKTDFRIHLEGEDNKYWESLEKHMDEIHHAIAILYLRCLGYSNDIIFSIHPELRTHLPSDELLGILETTRLANPYYYIDLNLLYGVLYPQNEHLLERVTAGENLVDLGISIEYYGILKSVSVHHQAIHNVDLNFEKHYNEYWGTNSTKAINGTLRIVGYINTDVAEYPYRHCFIEKDMDEWLSWTGISIKYRD